MSTLTLRGSLNKNQCLVPFWLQPGNFEGTAVIDTGFQHAAISDKFLARHGVTLPTVGECKLTTFGLPKSVYPRVDGTVRFLAVNGAPLQIRRDWCLCDVPGVDLLIGIDVLRLGRFTLFGPERTWEWSIDQITGAWPRL